MNTQRLKDLCGAVKNSPAGTLADVHELATLAKEAADNVEALLPALCDLYNMANVQVDGAAMARGALRGNYNAAMSNARVLVERLAPFKHG